MVRVLISAFLIFFLSIFPCRVSSTQAESPRNIILISLDTLRADHLGTYGYHRNTSPFIDAFAKESIVFEHAVVQAPNTLPSHMSIMTSLYPSFHGTWNKNSRLDDEHITLAELLQGKGYQTAAFVDGGFVSASFGFDQGFDIYDDQGRRIAQILPKVKKWLDENKSNPFFLFIHCFDIHSPYKPPPPYDRIFHDFTYTGHFNLSRKDQKLKMDVTEEDLRHLIALYDGGIRYTDEKIGEFLSYLRDSGLYDQSLIIITSDHGEEFQEHGGFLHWQIYYRPNLNVPLIMRIPNYPKEEIRINELVRSIDLLPTILELTELPPHTRAQGISLLPLIKRHTSFVNRSLWQVSRLFKKDSNPSFAEYGEYNWSIITDEGYQMIYNSVRHSIQLFDLKVDPLAQNNIAKDNEDIIKRLFSQHKEIYSKTPTRKAPTITLDEQTREQLIALGYLDGGINVIPKCPDDFDCDGIPDEEDNCPSTPNNQTVGTCTSGTVGEPCMSNGGCGTDGFCSMNQEDTRPPGGNGIGDACECEGDFDCDGDVDETDAASFKSDSGRSLADNPCTNENPCRGDFDCDGDVDSNDNIIFNEDFGRIPSNNPCPACNPKVPYCQY